MGAISGAGAAYTSRESEFTSSFSEVRVDRYIVLGVVLNRSLFVLFLLPDTT
jgi:hypothetical protein